MDANQIEIVAALRAIGASVQHAHTLGGGCPDLIVGLRGKTLLLEVKMPGEDLNATEALWFNLWNGHARIVRTPEEAVRAVMEETRA